MRNDLKNLVSDSASSSTISTQKNSSYVLGLDLEGINQNLLENGVNLAIDRVTEIGAILWNVEQAQPVKILSQLIDEADRLSIDPETSDLTGINDAMLEQWGAKNNDIKSTLTQLANMINGAEAVVAHNGTNYDRPMIEEMFKRYSLDLPEKTWIDTGRDIEYPRKISMRSMASLEHAHGFVNPFPHRAITDVFAMLKIFALYDYQRTLSLARSPKIDIIADLKAPNWRDPTAVAKFNKIKNKIAKARFKWNPTDKTWNKQIHEILIKEEKINFDFAWSIKA